MSVASVAVVAFPGINPFHLSVPGLVFGEDRGADGIPRFDVRVCCTAGRRAVPTSSGFAVTADYGLEGLEGAQTVFVPTWLSPEASPPASLLDALGAAHDAGSRIVGLCLGAFVLAAAGLLDGRRATTHWRYASQLASRYPTIEVDPNPLWVDLDDVVTSAGTAAGIDCCLHLVRRMLGADLANRIARRLVVAPHRAGDQSQYVEQPVPESLPSQALQATLVWGRQNLDRPITVNGLAARARMSRRTFTRHFRAATGTSPLQWLVNERLASAQGLLETTDLSIELIADRSGLGSTAAFRRHFRSKFGSPPQSYRRAFCRNP